MVSPLLTWKGTLPHSVKFDIVFIILILLCVLINYLSILRFILCISYVSRLMAFVICVCMLDVFLVLAVWLLTRHVNKNELKKKVWGKEFKTINCMSNIDKKIICLKVSYQVCVMNKSENFLRILTVGSKIYHRLQQIKKWLFFPPTRLSHFFHKAMTDFPHNYRKFFSDWSNSFQNKVTLFPKNDNTVHTI